MGDIAILDATPARPRGARVVRRTDGRLIPGGQSLSLCLAAVNGGYAGGFNICLAEVADGPKWDAIWILNPDTEPDPAALAALVAKSREKDYAIIGSRLLVKRTGRVQLYGGRWRPWIARGFNIGFNAPSEATPDVAAVEREMTYVNGAAMFVPRAFIERVGPMDERYFLYCDEIDWCWRRGSAPLGYAHNSSRSATSCSLPAASTRCCTRSSWCRRCS